MAVITERAAIQPAASSLLGSQSCLAVALNTQCHRDVETKQARSQTFCNGAAPLKAVLLALPEDKAKKKDTGNKESCSHSSPKK